MGQYKINPNTNPNPNPNPNTNTKYVLIYYVINAGLFFSLDPIRIVLGANPMQSCSVHVYSVIYYIRTIDVPSCIHGLD